MTKKTKTKVKTSLSKPKTEYDRTLFSIWLHAMGNKTPWKSGDYCPIATYMGISHKKVEENPDKYGYYDDANSYAGELDPLFTETIDKLTGGTWGKLNAKQVALVLDTINITNPI